MPFSEHFRPPSVRARYATETYNSFQQILFQTLINIYYSEPVVRRYSMKKILLNVLENSQENFYML